MLRTKTFSTQVIENAEAVLSFDVPNHFDTLVGLTIHSNADELLLKRGSVRLDMGSTMLIEEGEPVRLYQKPVGSGHVPTGEIPLAGTARRFTLRYRDTPATGTVFQPHKVSLTLYFQ